MATGSYLSRYVVNHYYSKKDKPSSYFPRIMNSVLIMVLGTCICALTSNIYDALVGVWIMAGARGVFLPANQAIMHDSFPETIRSTGPSMMNFIFEVFVAIVFLEAACSLIAYRQMSLELQFYPQTSGPKKKKIHLLKKPLFP